MARRQGPREVYRVAGLVALIKDHQLACSEGCQSHVRRKTAPILMRGVPQSLLCSGAVAKVGEVEVDEKIATVTIEHDSYREHDSGW